MLFVGSQKWSDTWCVESLFNVFRPINGKQILWSGSNDSREPIADIVDEKDHNDEVGLAKFHQALKSVIKHPYIAAEDIKVILVTPPPLGMEFQHTTDANGELVCIRSAVRTKKYIAKVRAIAKEHNLLLCDTESLLLEKAESCPSGLSSLSEDGKYSY